LISFAVPVAAHSATKWPVSMLSLDEGKLRRISFCECRRAQSFPDHYIFYGTQAQRYHQVGDAVPPLLARAVALAIKKDGEERRVDKPFYTPKTNNITGMCLTHIPESGQEAEE